MAMGVGTHVGLTAAPACELDGETIGSLCTSPNNQGVLDPVLVGISLPREGKNGYVEIIKTDEEEFEFVLEIKLGVNWDDSQKKVQILSGEFHLAQKTPLAVFSNAWWAMSQRGVTLQDSCNGERVRVEPGWEMVDYDPDSWVYGGTVGALGTDLMTGNSFVFNIECRLEEFV